MHNHIQTKAGFVAAPFSARAVHVWRCAAPGAVHCTRCSPHGSERPCRPQVDAEPWGPSRPKVPSSTPVLWGLEPTGGGCGRLLAVFPSPPPPPPCFTRQTVTILLGISRPAAFPGLQFGAFTSPHGAEARHRLAVCGGDISLCPPPPPPPPATSFCCSRPLQPLASVPVSSVTATGVG